MDVLALCELPLRCDCMCFGVVQTSTFRRCASYRCALQTCTFRRCASYHCGTTNAHVSALCELPLRHCRHARFSVVRVNIATLQTPLFRYCASYDCGCMATWLLPRTTWAFCAGNGNNQNTTLAKLQFPCSHDARRNRRGFSFRRPNLRRAGTCAPDKAKTNVRIKSLSFEENAVVHWFVPRAEREPYGEPYNWRYETFREPGGRATGSSAPSECRHAAWSARPPECSTRSKEGARRCKDRPCYPSIAPGQHQQPVLPFFSFYRDRNIIFEIGTTNIWHWNFIKYTY